MSFKTVNPQPTPSGAGGFSSSSNHGFTPGVDSGPRSPGEGADQFLAPDVPATEAQIAQMEKK